VSITDPITDLASEMADLAAELNDIITGLAALAADSDLSLETVLDGAELAVDAALTITHRAAASHLFDSEIIFWRRQRDRATRQMADLSGNPRPGAKAEMMRAQFRFGQACEQIAELEAAKADMLANNEEVV
jgi:hypothetical protein